MGFQIVIPWGWKDLMVTDRKESGDKIYCNGRWHPISAVGQHVGAGNLVIRKMVVNAPDAYTANILNVVGAPDDKLIAVRQNAAYGPCCQVNLPPEKPVKKISIQEKIKSYLKRTKFKKNKK
jgi:hypothetical protein